MRRSSPSEACSTVIGTTCGKQSARDQMARRSSIGNMENFVGFGLLLGSVVAQAGERSPFDLL